MSLLSSIKQRFFSNAFDINAISDWLLGFGILVAILLAYLIFAHFRSKKIRYNPYGSVSDPRMIRNIVTAAFDQRRPFEVQVQSEGDTRRPTLRCAPEHLSREAITLEINGLKSLSNKWLGHAVHVFFRIQVHKEFTFYSFSSRIDAIQQPKQGVCHITLPLPELLENRQKRSFFRITPPHEFFLGAALWHGDSMPKQEALTEISEWPRPKLLFIPGKLVQFQPIDLSAGGVRISVSSKEIHEMDLQFHVTEHILLMQDLLDPEQNKRLRFWLLCRIQNIWIDHATRDLHIGMQFMAWARARDPQDPQETTNGVEWLRLSSSNEVEALGNWIMRRHLQLYRDNPTSI